MSHAIPPSEEPSAEASPPPRRAAGSPAPTGNVSAGQPTFEQFSEVHRSEDFALLRGKFRRFAFPWTVAFLVWYFLYVLLSVYARDLMSTRVFGNVNLGILLGLLQFVTTFGLTWLYIRHANKSLDPIVTRIQDRVGAAGRADLPTDDTSARSTGETDPDKHGGR